MTKYNWRTKADKI